MREPLQLKHFELGAEDQPVATVDALAAFEIIKNFARRQWKLIVLAAVLGLALAAASLAVVPVKYEASAVVLIDKQRLHFFQQQSVVSDEAIETHAAIEGQLEILKSDVLAKLVMDKLHLEKDGDFTLPQPAPAWLAALGLGRSTPLTEAQRERFVLETFAKLRTIKRIGAAFAIEISFRSHSAELAAAVANALADAYLLDMRSASRVAARNASDWLQDRLADLRAQVAEAENAVVEFKTKHDLIDADGKPIVAQEITEISSQLTKARSQLSEVTARLERTQAAAHEYATSAVKPAMTEMLNNPRTSKFFEQYFELSNREAEYAARFGADHKATVRLRERMDELKAGMIEELQRLSQSFLSEKTIVERRIQDLEAALNAAIGNSRSNERVHIKLREHESIAQSYRALYDGLLSRHSEAVLQQQQPISGARVLSPATEPLSRVMKKPLLFATILAIGTTGLGVALSLLRDLKDRTFRTGEDIEQKLKSDFIAMVPTWRPEVTRRAAGRALVPADPAGAPRNNAYWAFMLSSTSDYAEAIGRVKFAILRHGNAADGRVFGFTSVLPNEGASTIAAGVVQSLAKSGRSVIMVDCDLRHPELTKEFAPGAAIGLQEILLGGATLDEAIVVYRSIGFAFLPGVVDRLRMRPEELLDTDELAAVLVALRQRYDYVIVDLPPMFPMLDVSMTDRLIDSYIIIVEWGTSKIDTVSHALARCPGVRNRVLGLVLNKVDFNRLRLYDRRMIDYYDERRYGNYLLSGPMERRLEND
jgi:polysaccharide biosynthesis transport protein